MKQPVRSVVRHVLAALFLALAILGGFIPILQGWMFFLLAVFILALEYRWVRNVALRPFYRRFPEKYRKMTRWRRRMKRKCSLLIHGRRPKKTIRLRPPAPKQSSPPSTET